MRLLETLFLAANLLALVVLSSLFLVSNPWVRRASLIFVAALALLGFWAEGYRWQLSSAYVLTAALILVGFFFARTALPITKPEAWAGWVLLAVAAAAVIIFPAFAFPTPSGHYRIGTTIRYLVDTGRREKLGPDRAAPREVMIQIWYPAESFATGKRASYVLDRAQAGSFPYSQQATVKTHAIIDAPICRESATYPVVLYSPSWHGQRFQNTYIVEELASHGFVVVGIDHPYGSHVTVFPDGRKVYAAKRAFWDLSSDESQRQSIVYLDDQVNIRAHDAIFVAREMRRMDAPGSGDLLSGRLDLSDLGIFGYSFGGAVAAQACWLDRRFKAGINIDGSMFGDVAESGIPQPFMFIDEEKSIPAPSVLTIANGPKRRNAEMNARDFRLERHSLGTYGGYSVMIKGTDHGNFEDSALITPVGFLTGAGSINRWRALHLVSVTTLAFFDKYLKQSQAPVLDGPTPAYPELTVKYYQSDRPSVEPASSIVPDSH